MLTLLDTNVISEQSKSTPDSNVVRYLRQLDPDDSFLSSISFGELISGISLMPVGRRRSALSNWLEELSSSFDGRIVSVDLAVALEWGRVNAEIKSSGYMLEPADGMIAATALVHDMTLATRNTRHFERTGVRLINPWEFDQS